MTEYKPKSPLLRILTERGFLYQCTDLPALDARLMRGDPVSAYIGFDATADSLHVGSLMQIMMLRWLQKCGHRPIVLMGGGTTKVGDPSGKEETRQLLTTRTINQNIKGIRAVFDKYISFGDGVTDAIQPNNADWLDKLKYVNFLRDIGRHFTINKMMTMDSVKTRLDREQPLTFLEFNYMLLQSYDFLQLHERHGCELQIGGSDQWGNIVNGVDLTRRMAGEQVFGLTSLLLTKADGSKMGKTATGAIWLNKDRLRSNEFWQFWRNTADADVGRFLKLFTELPVKECERLGALQGQDINEAKIILATEVCALCHGRKAAERAAKTAKEVFEKGSVGSELPTIRINKKDFTESTSDLTKPPYIERFISLVKLLVKANLAPSSKEAKRMITKGSVRINNKVINTVSNIAKTSSDSVTIIQSEHFDSMIKIAVSASKLKNEIANIESRSKEMKRLIIKLDEYEKNSKSKTLKISVGKKRHALVEFDD